MIEAFNHVGISVADLDRSVAFYRDLLGMNQACEPFPFAGEQYAQIMALDEPEGRICVMSGPGFMLELFEFALPEVAPQDADRPVAKRGLTHFGITVSDIGATHARLSAAGVRFHSPVLTFAGGMQAAYARDPDGNVFELLERAVEP